MGRKRHLHHGSQVIYPVQTRFVLGRIVSAEEQIDGIGMARPQAFRQGAAYPGGGCRRTKRIHVADLIQTNVALDVFCELNGIA